MVDIFKQLEQDGEIIKEVIANSMEKEVTGLNPEETWLANLEAEQATRVCEECGERGGHSNFCIKCE